MFESYIINNYGKKGREWLGKLSRIVEQVSSRLKLHDLKPVPNLTYNYVLSGFQGTNPIILKLGLDIEDLKREASALKCFAGQGAVKLMEEDEGLILLERAVPGTSLIKHYLPNEDIKALEIACKVMKNLHQARIPKNHNFPHIKDWLSALDKDWEIPTSYLQKARELRDQLLQTSSADVLLHGDLHPDNILQNGNDWVVIDPKGVIGEASYEIAAFIRNPIPELLSHDNASSIIKYRITHFAKILGLEKARIMHWCFVQAVLCWAWAIEDKCDVDYWKRITKIMDDLDSGPI